MIFRQRQELIPARGEKPELRESRSSRSVTDGGIRVMQDRVVDRVTRKEGVGRREVLVNPHLTVIHAGSIRERGGPESASGEEAARA